MTQDNLRTYMYILYSLQPLVDNQVLYGIAN